MLSSDQQQSSASFPSPLPRRIWFLLVDSETREPYKGVGIDAVSLSPGADIIQFRDMLFTPRTPQFSLASSLFNLSSTRTRQPLTGEIMLMMKGRSSH
eukprot:CCRYP_019549-RA/>CCRYP_019549-RA protein AED:0.46 eAED:0.46 QI:0/-1/0/1/-1/1/1/0/97